MSFHFSSDLEICMRRLHIRMDTRRGRKSAPFFNFDETIAMTSGCGRNEEVKIESEKIATRNRGETNGESEDKKIVKRDKCLIRTN